MAIRRPFRESGRPPRSSSSVEVPRLDPLRTASSRPVTGVVPSSSSAQRMASHLPPPVATDVNASCRGPREQRRKGIFRGRPGGGGAQRGRSPDGCRSHQSVLGSPFLQTWTGGRHSVPRTPRGFVTGGTYHLSGAGLDPDQRFALLGGRTQGQVLEGVDPPAEPARVWRVARLVLPAHAGRAGDRVRDHRPTIAPRGSLREGSETGAKDAGR
jgi:hypothetical protein